MAVLAIAAATAGLIRDRLGDLGDLGDVDESNQTVPTPQDKAEVFAVRALVAAGLYGPRGLYYSFSEDEVERHGSHSWRVAFGATRCGTFHDENGARYETCKPLSGEDALGNARTDSWLLVALRDGDWHVSAAEGNFTTGARQELVGFSLPDRTEAAHWEFPAVVARRAVGSRGMMVEASNLWVGPIPYAGPGSICTVVAVHDGRVVHRGDPMYLGAPDDRWQRAGGSWGEQLRGRADEGRVDCEPFKGAGWQPERIELGVRLGHVRVFAPLRYHGRPVFNPEGECRAVLYADDDEILGTGFQQIRGVDLLRDPKQRSYVLSFRIETNRPGAATRADVTCRMA